MAAEFDIGGVFFSKESLDSFKSLEEQAKRTAESMKQIALQKDAIFGGTGKGGVSKTQEKLVADLERANAKMKAMAETHAAKMVELETKLQGQLEMLREKALLKEAERSKKKIKAKEDELIAFQNAQSKENTLDEIATQKRISNDAKILMKKTESEQRILLMQQAAADKKAAREASAEAKEQARLKREEERINKRIQKELDAVAKIEQAQRRSDSKAAFTQKTGYMNTLEKEINDLIFALHRMEEAELKAFGGQQAILNIKNKRAELAGLRAAYGDNRMYVGEYSRGVNGLKQSMTMLAGEMPNFAQSFRIGMMSLSNNWMGLSQAISIAKKEQKMYMEQFKAGLIDKKPDSLFKMITKSIFSMNLLLMVAVTVLQVYNEELGDWFENLFNVNTQLKITKELSKDLRKSGFEKMKSDQEKLRLFAVDYNKAVRDGNQDRLTQLEKVADKEYGVHKEKLKQIGENVNAWRVAFKDYLTTAEKTYWNEALAKKRAEAEMNLAEAKMNKTMFGEEIKDEKTPIGRKNVKKLIDEGKMTIAFGAAGEYKKAVQTITTSQKQIAALNKMTYFDVYSKPLKEEKQTKPKAAKQFTEINVTREYYKSEEEMLKRLADLQNDITKENENGELNSYEKRLKAAKLYYETVIAMAMGEQNVAIANELSKTSSEKDSTGREKGSEYKSAYNKYDNNVKKFGMGSPEQIKSLTELEEAKKIIAANSADAILKINDEYAKKQIAAEKKRAKEVLDIENDIYKEKVYYIESEAKLRAQMEEALSNQQSIGSRIAGGLGLKDNRAFRSASNKRGSEMSTIKEKLKGATGTDKDNLEKELANASAADAQANELEAMRLAEDAKASIASDSIATLKALWDAYYQYQMEQIDKELETQTKVNDEKVKQYEDEAEAGMHSAKEVSDFKDNMAVYQEAQDKEAARKKAELEKQQFLLQQAFALGQVWINFAIASTSPANVGGLLTPLLLAQAIASTALIAAQTIPAFEHGGDVKESGLSLVGEKRHELVYDPKTGKAFITPAKPTFMNLDKGMHVYPDINKLDLDNFNLSQRMLPMVTQDDRLLDEIKQLNRTMSRQKTPQINGMRLLQQLQYSEKSLSNRRGLLN